MQVEPFEPYVFVFIVKEQSVKLLIVYYSSCIGDWRLLSKHWFIAWINYITTINDYIEQYLLIWALFDQLIVTFDAHQKGPHQING